MLNILFPYKSKNENSCRGDFLFTVNRKIILMRRSESKKDLFGQVGRKYFFLFAPGTQFFGPRGTERYFEATAS